MSDDESPKPPRRWFGRRRDPAKPGRLAQIKQVYDLTRKFDPNVTWFMLGAAVLIVGLGLLIGFLTGHPIYATFLALPLALIAVMFILSRRADKVMYKQLEGQPGAAGAALRLLRRGWTVEEEPIAVDARNQDTVFRVLGRAGLVLVGDGPPHRIGKLLKDEERKHRRFVSNAPITLIQAGSAEGQIPMKKLAGHIMRLKGTLTKDEVQQISARLRAIPGVRAPLPKGIDPMRARPNRRAMRGR